MSEEGGSSLYLFLFIFQLLDQFQKWKMIPYFGGSTNSKTFYLPVTDRPVYTYVKNKSQIHIFIECKSKVYNATMWRWCCEAPSSSQGQTWARPLTSTPSPSLEHPLGNSSRPLSRSFSSYSEGRCVVTSSHLLWVQTTKEKKNGRIVTKTLSCVFCFI